MLNRHNEHYNYIVISVLVDCLLNICQHFILMLLNRHHVLSNLHVNYFLATLAKLSTNVLKGVG